ncbi:hypothetical protein [Streptomyces antimycoticus]|uniref:hypothetical protein n=1 Tax=Streptomyces antimycoticus TaxID=68175 RepID=UPI000A3893C1|nr:hypothetical protein [Streptomyces antimycoticus]
MTTPTTAAEPDPMRRPDALRLATDLRSAEDELGTLRGQLREAVTFVHDPAYDIEPRRALARRLGVHEPTDIPTVPAAAVPHQELRAVPTAR